MLIEDLSLKLLALITKPEILENNNTFLELTKSDLLDKNRFLKRKDVHLGFAAEQELRQLRLRDSLTLNTIYKFRKEAMQVLCKESKKSIVTNVSVFNPKQVVSEKPDQLKEKLRKLLHHLIYLNQVTAILSENSWS